MFGRKPTPKPSVALKPTAMGRGVSSADPGGAGETAPKSSWRAGVRPGMSNARMSSVRVWPVRGAHQRRSPGPGCATLRVEVSGRRKGPTPAMGSGRVANVHAMLLLSARGRSVSMTST